MGIRLFSVVLICFAVLLLLSLLSACSTPNITNTPRSAVEQMLLSAVVERGIKQADFSAYSGKKIFLNYEFLAPQVDKALIQAYLELHLAVNGAIVTRTEAEADYVIQPSCGILATDVDKILIGTPALPIPVPDTDISIVIPEIPLFLKLTRSAVGRFFFTVTDAKTHLPHQVIDGVNSRAEHINWVILLFPFKSHNVSLYDGEEPAHHYILPYEN